MADSFIDQILEPLQPRQVRKRMVDTAIVLFAKKGRSGVTVDDIAREAKVSVGSIYRHFQSKEGLYQHAFQYYSERAGLFLRADTPWNDVPELRFRFLWRRMTRFAREAPAQLQFLLVAEQELGPAQSYYVVHDFIFTAKREVRFVPISSYFLAALVWSWFLPVTQLFRQDESSHSSDLPDHVRDACWRALILPDKPKQFAAQDLVRIDALADRDPAPEDLPTVPI